jgi:hypothetical protein
VFRGQSLFVGINFTQGNSERLRERAKETKAAVDLKKPSLPSFSSVEFLVRLRLIFFALFRVFRGQPPSLRRNQFTEGNEGNGDFCGRSDSSFSWLSSVRNLTLCFVGSLGQTEPRI